MPIYEYKCPSCQKAINVWMKSWEEAYATKISCVAGCEGVIMQRQISPSSFQVQGFSSKNGYSK